MFVRKYPRACFDAHRQGCSPTHGYEPTREAAMAAFAKSWRMGRAVMTE
jgi:hypothetical protein